MNRIHEEKLQSTASAQNPRSKTKTLDQKAIADMRNSGHGGKNHM